MGCNTIIFMKIVTYMVVDVLYHERYYKNKKPFQKGAKHYFFGGCLDFGYIGLGGGALAEKIQCIHRFLKNYEEFCDE